MVWSHNSEVNEFFSPPFNIDWNNLLSENGFYGKFIFYAWLFGLRYIAAQYNRIQWMADLLREKNRIFCKVRVECIVFPFHQINSGKWIFNQTLMNKASSQYKHFSRFWSNWTSRTDSIQCDLIIFELLPKKILHSVALWCDSLKSKPLKAFISQFRLRNQFLIFSNSNFNHN